MLAISKVFIIFSLLCLCWGKGIPSPSGFQNKSVSLSCRYASKQIQLMYQLKGKGRSFWIGQTQIYLLNYLLHLGVMLTIKKVFIILFLLCLWLQGRVRQFSKQMNKLSFQLSVHVCFLLGNFLILNEKQFCRAFVKCFVNWAIHLFSR